MNLRGPDLLTFSEPLQTVIIGAGPSGLAAAIGLAEHGRKPLVLERDHRVGGLMKSYSWDGFVFDLGRKEMYSRVGRVEALWEDLLGQDYRPYPHRVGSLFGGRILELSGQHRGMFRGVPPMWVSRGGIGLAWSWARHLVSEPTNYEEYWHSKVGGVFARMLAQGYWEKFRGQRWAEMPVPETEIDGSPHRSHAFSSILQCFKLAGRGGVSTQKVWRHPAKGTGQVWEEVHRRLQERQVPIHLSCEVTAVEKIAGRYYRLQTREKGREPTTLVAQDVVSSLPIENLHSLLQPRRSGLDGGVLPGSDAERSVLLVYLFFGSPPRFPHAWLEVNDPTLKCGRITSFSAFNGEMVPRGKSCLCIEYFCGGDDPLLEADDEELADLALNETARDGLISPETLLHKIVFRLKRTNAAASWREWQREWRTRLLCELEDHPHLYHTNRPGSDLAALAGLVAADCILAGDRSEFDRLTNPAKRYVEG